MNAKMALAKGDNDYTVAIDVQRALRRPTGSEVFDLLLGGGLPSSSMTDIFGAAGTGKTQFAFLNSLMASVDHQVQGNVPAVVFVDCAGSFRPERILEMAECRGFRNPRDVLERISSIYVRSVDEQVEASERILASLNGEFSKVKLVVIDDVTANFAAELPLDSGEEEVASEPGNEYILRRQALHQQRTEEDMRESLILRHHRLSTYARKLAYISIRANISVLLTNSVRSKMENPAEEEEQEEPEERSRSESALSGLRREHETTGDTIAQFSLFRLRFEKGPLERRRAQVLQPYIGNKGRNLPAEFRIEAKGIVP